MILVRMLKRKEIFQTFSRGRDGRRRRGGDERVGQDEAEAEALQVGGPVEASGRSQELPPGCRTRIIAIDCQLIL